MRQSLIRPYAAGDKEILLDIFRKNIPRYFDAKEINDLEGYLDQYPTQQYILEIDGNVVGTAGISHDDDGVTGRISWVFFDPTHQGQGHGRLMMRYVLTKLESDKQLAGVIVRTSQHAADFFEKFGFAVKLVRRNFWGKGLDLHFMYKDLT